MNIRNCCSEKKNETKFPTIDFQYAMYFLLKIYLLGPIEWNPGKERKPIIGKELLGKTLTGKALVS